jgi:hypothetical protein
MPDYRRRRVPGGTCFFTINLLERRADLLVRHIDALREAVRRTRRERPFHKVGLYPADWGACGVEDSAGEAYGKAPTGGSAACAAA